MNEEKIIIDIELNSEDLKKRIADLTNQIELQKSTLKKYKDSVGEVDETYVQLNSEMKANQEELKKHNDILNNTVQIQRSEITTIESLRKANKLLTVERNNLNLETKEGQTRIKEINEALDENNQKIKQNSDVLTKQKINIGNYTDSVLDALKIHDELKQSYQNNISNLKNLSIAYNQIIVTQGEESEAAKDVKIQLDLLNATLITQQNELKDLEKQNDKLIDSQEEVKDSIGETKKSVNDLGSAMQGGFLQVAGYFQEIQKQEGGMSNFFGTMKNGFMNMMKAAKAFIATPLGMILTALAGAFGVVSAAMSKNKELSNTVSDTWTGIKSSLSGVWDSMTNLAASAVEGIRGNTEKMKKYAMDSANAMKNVVTGVTAANAVALEQMKRQNAQLNDLSANVIAIEQRKLQTLEAMQNNQALSAKDKIGLEIAIAKQKNEITKENIAIAEREAMEINKLRQNELKTTGQYSDELGRKYDEATRKVSALENDLVANSIATSNELRNIQKDNLNETLDYMIDNYDKHKTNNEKIINNDKETFENRFALLEETKKLSLENTQLQVKEIEKFGKVKIDLDSMLKQTNGLELANQIKSLNLSEDIGLRLFEIIKERQAAVGDFYDLENSLIQAKTDADLKSLNTSLEYWKEENKTKLDGNKRLNEQIVSEEEKRLNLLKTKELENIKAQYEAGSINLDEYNLNILKKENEIGAQLLAVRKSYDEQSKAEKIERDAIDYENRYAIAEGNIFAELELQKQKLELERQNELQAAEMIGADKNLINEKYRKIDNELEWAAFDSKMQIAKVFTDGIANLFEQNTIVGKAAAVAQATINTYMGATAAFAQTPGGIIIKSAAAALAVAAGLKSIKKILTVNTSVKGGSASSNVSNDTSGGGGASNISSLTTQNAQMVAPSIGQGIVSRNTMQNTTQTNVNQPVLVVDNVTNAQMNNNKMNEIASF